MASLLLPIIYLAFISLGLPDGLLGSAWPSMYQGMGASISWAGIISMIIAAGTVVSSLSSQWIHARLGTGKITAISVFLTAAALLGFSISHSFWMLCLFAIPYGIGAGSVDAVLNNYVALHYKARHMSWLHAMWGIGCSIGPLIMSRAIIGSTWNSGYGIVAGIQIALTMVLCFTLPMWKDRKNTPSEAGTPNKPHALGDLIRLPGVKQVMITFFCYCALESTTGMWAASYCSLYRGVSPEQSAAWASLFYIGITIGRIICGFITFKVNGQNMIRLGQALVAVGILFILLPFGHTTLLLGLVFVGLGCAPIYPSIIHETPANFGEASSQGVIGIQMASAYVGTTLMPPLFGFLADRISFVLFPFFLIGVLILMFIMAERLHSATASHREQYEKGH